MAQAVGIENFLQQCQALEDGFAALSPDTPWRLGGVVLINAADGFATVRKAAKPGYEFSGDWALPGGMVRVSGAGQSLRARIDAALRERARAEAGLTLQALIPLNALGPVVTRYTAKRRLRHTLVAAFESAAPTGARLEPADPSIQAARWAVPTTELSGFAPANRLILGHRLWPCLDADHQEAARRVLAEAVEACGDYAAEVGVIQPPPPWASSTEIRAWSRSWPTSLSSVT